MMEWMLVLLSNKASNKRVKNAPFGRWDVQKARTFYPYRWASR